jgi:hypothetical protein
MGGIPGRTVTAVTPETVKPPGAAVTTCAGGAPRHQVLEQRSQGFTWPGADYADRGVDDRIDDLVVDSGRE